MYVRPSGNEFQVEDQSVSHSVSLSVCLSVSLSICLSIYLTIYVINSRIHQLLFRVRSSRKKYIQPATIKSTRMRCTESNQIKSHQFKS